MSGQHLYNAQQQPNAYHEKGNEEPTPLTEEQQQLKLMDEFEEQAEWLKSHGRSAEVLSIPLLGGCSRLAAHMSLIQFQI